MADCVVTVRRRDSEKSPHRTRRAHIPEALRLDPSAAQLPAAFFNRQHGRQEADRGSWAIRGG
jgi:hypothetical protein